MNTTLTKYRKLAERVDAIGVVMNGPAKGVTFAVAGDYAWSEDTWNEAIDRRQRALIEAGIGRDDDLWVPIKYWVRDAVNARHVSVFPLRKGAIHG